MSTLGGSKGERNAKPKFTALDINRLYKNSRGESVEPSQQKNQVPRKHGMQSLGKVPSARRPPANLPSLKAEIKTPGNNNNSKTSEGGNQTQLTSNATPLVGVSSNSSLKSINSINNNTSLQNSSVNERHTSSAHSHSHSHSALSNSSSVTWSSVTTGPEQGGNSVPPHYQSPQFQHEFPSLHGNAPGTGTHKSSSQNKDTHQQNPNYNARDGNGIVVGSGGTGNQKISQDTNEVSLRPQTDSNSWIQQHGKGGNEVSHGNQQAQVHPAASVPQPLRALLPSFMYRGNGSAPPPDTGTLSGPRSLTPPTLGSQMNGNYSMNQGSRMQRNASHHDSNEYNRSNSPSYRNLPNMKQRPPPLHTPPLGGYGRGGSRDRDAVPFVEPEVVLIQRPIIKEEDLERMNAIAQEEGWMQQGEIDYNQKLAFSDDESPENSPVAERDRPAFNKQENKKTGNGQQQQRQQHSQGQPQSQPQTQDDSRSSWQKDRGDSERSDREKDRDRDSEPRDSRPINQQNGHRTISGNGGGHDSSFYERAKIRKEEEEKREIERKQAAAKKLQALEMKLNKKGSSNLETVDSSSLDDVRNKDDEYHHTSSQNRRVTYKENREYGRYDKYERDAPHPRGGDKDSGFGNRTNMNTGGQSAGGVGGPNKNVFSIHFQSNLPPRFQRQQQAATSGVAGQGSPANNGGNVTGGNANNNNTRTITANQSHNYQYGSDAREKSNVPFAQQYDPRYIHSQNYKQQQQQMRRNDRGDNSYNNRSSNYGRVRGSDNNSENDDDRYSNRGSNHDYGRGSGTHMGRTISESSQRKTSVSSSDDQKLNDMQRSDSRDFVHVGSWAEETDAEIKRQRGESFSSSHSKNDDEIHVKQILQRPSSKTFSENSAINDKIEEIDEKNDEKAQQQPSTESNQNKHNEQTFTPTQILRRSESPKTWSESSLPNDESKEKIASNSLIKNNEEPAQTTDDNVKANVSSQKISTNVDNEKVSTDTSDLDLNPKKVEEKSDDNLNKQQRDQKRTTTRSGSGTGSLSHSGRQDIRGQSNRNYGSYRGSGNNSGNGSWNRRGNNMRMGGRNYNNDWSESENSEDVGEDDYGRRSNRSPKIQRKDHTSGGNMRDNRGSSSNKEGFAPRGEPSRRGRGGGMSSISSSYRRGGGDRGGASGPGSRRNDSYGQSSVSKSSYSSNNTTQDDKDNKKDSKLNDELNVDDKTKQSQIALNAGLKKAELNEDKNKGKTLQSGPPQQTLPKRDEKRSTPPKSQGNNASYQSQRKETTVSLKNDETRKDDVERENERKKSLSKEKEISPSLNNQLSRTTSNSSRGVGSVPGTGGSQSQFKKDDRLAQKTTIAKLPPGLGYKSNSNLNQSSTQSSANITSMNKDQGIQKSKSSNDARIDRNNATTISNKVLPQRMPNKWDTNRRDIRREDEKLHDISDTTNDSKSNNQKSDKTILDGSSPPVNTIIFENTNYKSSVQTPTPQIKRQVSNQSDASSQGSNQNLKKSEENIKQVSTAQQQEQLHVQHTVQHGQHQQTEAITTAISQMTFNKQPTEPNEYEKEMKIGFQFDTEFGHLSEDKNVSVAVTGGVANTTVKPVPSGLIGQRPSGVNQHVPSSSGQSTISPSTAELNMKIASVKKVWESVPPMPTVLEHNLPSNENDSHLQSNFVSSQQQHQQHMQQFVAAHGVHAGNMHIQHPLSSPGPQSYGNAYDQSMEQHFGQKDSSGSVISNSNDNEIPVSYNPCQPHMGQNQSSGAGANLSMKHASEALAPSNGNLAKLKSSQQQMHPSALGLSPPPNMQQHQQQQQQQQGQSQIYQATAVAAAANQQQQFYQASQYTGMPTIPSPPTVLFNSTYAPFPMESRSQFSQFPGHYGTTSSNPYSAYTMQTPPNMPTAQAPEMYQNLSSQFRMGSAVQNFNQNQQQINNPNTVLISSSSNSLMSASVKPSSQQISAIGPKNNATAVAPSATVGPQYSQQYMGLYPPQQAPPPQLPSNSYYSNSGGGQGAFYSAPTPPGATQNYGIQAAGGGIFGGHGGPTQSSGPPQQIANFNSQFMNSPLLTASLNQFRGGPTPQTQAYMKSSQGQNHMQDSMGRQLKSPLGADVSLNLAKQAQSQQSPPHHKNYNWDMNQVMQQQQSQQPNPQNVRGGPQNNMNPSSRQGPGPQRYPAPIQRPNNYPQHPLAPQSQMPPQPQQQRSMRQVHSGPQCVGSGTGGPPMNKNYYGNNNNGGNGGNRGSHVAQQNEQLKQSDKDTNSQQEMTVKEDNSND